MNSLTETLAQWIALAGMWTRAALVAAATIVAAMGTCVVGCSSHAQWTKDHWKITIDRDPGEPSPSTQPVSVSTRTP